MRKIGALILSMMILFSGCGNKEKNIETLDVSDPDNFADCLAVAISERDSNEILKYFADSIKEYDENLDEEVKTFVDSFQGDYVSYELKYSDSSKHSRPEKEDLYKEKVLANYEFTTTENVYLVSFIYYNETPLRKYLGVQSLGVQEAESFYNEPFIFGNIRGCYVVSDDNHEELLQRKEHDAENYGK